MSFAEVPLLFLTDVAVPEMFLDFTLFLRAQGSEDVGTEKVAYPAMVSLEVTHPRTTDCRTTGFLASCPPAVRGAPPWFGS